MVFDSDEDDEVSYYTVGDYDIEFEEDREEPSKKN